MTRDMAQIMLPAEKKENFLSPIFLIFISENDAKHRKPNSFITPMTRDMGQNYAASSKNGKLFVANFSDFYLAVSAFVNDAKHQKSNSFITPMTRDMGQKYAASSVMRWTKQAFSCSKFLSPGGQIWANTAFEGLNSIALGFLNFTAGLT